MNFPPKSNTYMGTVDWDYFSSFWAHFRMQWYIHTDLKKPNFFQICGITADGQAISMSRHFRKKRSIFLSNQYNSQTEQASTTLPLPLSMLMMSLCSKWAAVPTPWCECYLKPQFFTPPELSEYAIDLKKWGIFELPRIRLLCAQVCSEFLVK